MELIPSLPLSTVVEWYELHCKQLAHTYSTLWGKKTKHPRYNNVSRVFLSFSLAFNTIPRYGYYRIRKIFRNQLSNKKELPSLLMIIYSAHPLWV